MAVLRGREKDTKSERREETASWRMFIVVCLGGLAVGRNGPLSAEPQHENRKRVSTNAPIDSVMHPL